MTTMPSYLVQNPRKWISLLQIVFTISTYILIFYIFNLHPSSIFKNTKILFFISNTLILIIAADYGEFTNKEKHDLYQEYAMTRSNSRNSTVFASGYSQNPQKARANCITTAEETKNSSAEEETQKEIVCVRSLEETPEKILQIAVELEPENTTAKKSEPIESVKGIDNHKEACETRNRELSEHYCRNRSRKTRRARSIAERNSEIERREKNAEEKVYERSKSEGSKWMIVGEKWENVEEETEEFSKMSNEELNRRVEEFIQRFNRQIQLQSLRNRQILPAELRD